MRRSPGEARETGGTSGGPRFRCWSRRKISYSRVFGSGVPRSPYRRTQPKDPNVDQCFEFCSDRVGKREVSKKVSTKEADPVTLVFPRNHDS